jgi:hypothetical protein
VREVPRAQWFKRIGTDFPLPNSPVIHCFANALCPCSSTVRAADS